MRKTRWAKSEISFGPVGRIGWSMALAGLVLMTPFYFVILLVRWVGEALRDLWKPVTRRVL